MSNTIQPGGYAASIAASNQMHEAMNIPEMIMAIQIERATILDGQIKGQMGDMQKRNEWLKDANAALAALRSARPTEKDGKVDYTELNFTTSAGETKNVVEWMEANGIATGLDRPAIAEAERAKSALDAQIAFIDQGAAEGKWTTEGSGHWFPYFTDRDGNQVQTDNWAAGKGYADFGQNTANERGTYPALTSLREMVTTDIANLRGFDQNEFDAAIANVKSSVDTVNTTSQMDMVRLQGLLDKRGQAFDLLSNTLSKLGKSMDTPIGNMR
jgi:hypothetical protein